MTCTPKVVLLPLPGSVGIHFAADCDALRYNISKLNEYNISKLNEYKIYGSSYVFAATEKHVLVHFTGKSTLLNILTMRESSAGKLSGSVTVNGTARDQTFLQISGYVPQVCSPVPSSG